MKTRIFLTVAALLCGTCALAHFGAIIPSDDIVDSGESPNITLDIKFIHPMEGHFMQMERPTKVEVFARGSKSDLTDKLNEQRKDGFSWWKLPYAIKRPGDHIFMVEPAPYWEPAEEAFIIHLTKVVVGAMGLEVGWDEPTGAKVEILPLTRPYGLWTGNIFTGVVLKDGKPLPSAEVEVEYLNEDGIKPPSDSYITQVVKADESGVFSYAMPREGWWGFAALVEGDEKLEHEGKLYPVEIGGVFWVKTRDMK
ncbi:MAG: DUF4198 domain-containing protein [Deltaproteobacteria bacterium]|nr:MAG: DUF4198 domain-containing protein [Deltaproteobacteria bacterium]